MAWGDDGRDEAPDTRVFRTDQRKAAKEWTCTSCRKRRPAGELVTVAAGKQDGEFFYERTCAALGHGDECPFTVRSWPIWRGTFELREDWRQVSGDWHGAKAPPPTFTHETRARTKPEAEAEMKEREESNAEYRLARVEQIEAGTPDDAPAAAKKESA